MSACSSSLIRTWAALLTNHQRGMMMMMPSLKTQARFTSSASPSLEYPPRSSPSTTTTSDGPLKANEVVTLLQGSPELSREVIMRLSPSKRRQLLVAASYYEWFGDEITAGQTSQDVMTSGSCRGSYVEERNYASASSSSAGNVNSGDSATDVVSMSSLSSSPTSSSPSPASSSVGSRHTSFSTSPSGVITDSNAAANSSWEELRRRRRERWQQEEEHRIRKEMQEAHPIPSLPMTRKEYDEWMRSTIQSMKTPTPASGKDIPFRVLAKVALQTGLPFMAFGTLDNSMLILAGDMLDNWIGADLKLSPMGAAGLGGIVSGVVGIQIHGLAERAVTKYGPPPPALKPSQWRSSRVQSSIHWGGTFGLVCGLFCGMFPLLLISDSTSVRRALETEDGEAPQSLIESRR